MYLCLVIWLDENSALGTLNFGENLEAPSHTINPFQQILFASMNKKPIFSLLDYRHKRRSLQNPPTFYMVDFWLYFWKKIAQKRSSNRRIVKMFPVVTHFWEGWTFTKSKSLSSTGIPGIVNEEP